MITPTTRQPLCDYTALPASHEQRVAEAESCLDRAGCAWEDCHVRHTVTPNGKQMATTWRLHTAPANAPSGCAWVVGLLNRTDGRGAATVYLGVASPGPGALVPIWLFRAGVNGAGGFERALDATLACMWKYECAGAVRRFYTNLVDTAINHDVGTATLARMAARNRRSKNGIGWATFGRVYEQWATYAGDNPHAIDLVHSLMLAGGTNIPPCQQMATCWHFIHRDIFGTLED